MDLIWNDSEMQSAKRLNLMDPLRPDLFQEHYIIFSLFIKAIKISILESSTEINMIYRLILKYQA